MEKNKSNFILNMIKKDVEEEVFTREIHTRFPPEPNGYLHIGSAYAININYRAAKEFNGRFNLRFDDTNPEKEDMKYVDAIVEDMKWLGIEFEDNIYYGSDYFEKLYEIAVDMIKRGKAYVCDLTQEEMRKYRGTLKTEGKNSPYRDRSVSENLDLFERMKNGEFAEGERILRAKIDMSSKNINLRDPAMYRISYKKHYRRNNDWCIYPMYDFAHPIQDAIEEITHSMCSSEFKDHRPLYDWFLKEAGYVKEPPVQREFGRMGLTNVVMSKRYLKALVENKIVDGWDDPRMPTLSGMRRRGYTREGVLNFLNEIGVSKDGSIVDYEMLEHFIRDDLKLKVPRIMGVLNPLEIEIINWDEEKVEWLESNNNVENKELGERKIPLTRNIYIEREDFVLNPSKKLKKLSLGEEVRLMKGYFIKCVEIIKDESTGEVTKLKCTYDEETKSGLGFNKRKPKGTIHWVSKKYGVKAEVRKYFSLLKEENTKRTLEEGWFENVNDDSICILENCILEPIVKEDSLFKFQLIRHGYFSVDEKYAKENKLILNETVSLKKK